MKHRLTIACLFMAGLSSLAAQTPGSVSSKLAGIQRFTVPAASSRPIGVNFVRPPLAAGRMDSRTSTTFTDNQVNFGTLLAGKSNLWLELTNGNYRGMATPVTVASANTLNTEDSLVPYAPGAAVFEVREAHTVATLFGATNTAGLHPSTTLNLSGNPDEIHIPDGAGGYHRVFYSTPAGGWRQDGDEISDASGIPIYHVDAVIIHRKQASALTLSFVGFVRSTPTYFPVITGTTTIFNAAYYRDHPHQQRSGDPGQTGHRINRRHHQHSQQQRGLGCLLLCHRLTALHQRRVETSRPG
ncbi:hypothetical protein [Verrucomicrobium spinosum]|uniref:hypothetical protein n=1 Tax=Verrucomicrobium spinosum TaxID=2736 RepID=UPI000B1243BF|nr:hypothetical protein [Verrucomicrobium spinosum]